MAIKRPGLRAREGTSLKKLSLQPRRRPSAVSLSMTSMIDVLVVLTVFLLITFEASPECHATGRKLPVSENAELFVIDAPSIDVRASAMFLDGTTVSSFADLGTKLRARRDTWKALHPGKTMPPNIALAIDADVPSGTVKAVVKTAAECGYASIDFIVLTR